MGLGIQISVFLIEAVFSLYIAAVVIRLLLGFARANFHNPLSQFLVTITNPVLVPMRRFIPSVAAVDTSAVVLAFVLTAIKLGLIKVLVSGGLHFPSLLIQAVGELLITIIWIYIVALIIQAVISWVGNAQHNPIIPLINSLTSPIVRPLRKVIPLIGMMDLSPLVAILGLNVLLMIVSQIFA
jgi:YggT family protein